MRSVTGRINTLASRVQPSQQVHVPVEQWLVGEDHACQSDVQLGSSLHIVTMAQGQRVCGFLHTMKCLGQHYH